MAAKKETIRKLISEQICNLWKLTDEIQKKAIHDNVTFSCFKKNQTIYKELDTPDRVMFLLQGKVKIGKEGLGGKHQIMRVAKQGQFFGYRAYFANDDYRTSAIALEQSTVAFLPGRIVESIMRHNFYLTKRIIEQLAKELGRADSRAINLTQKHVRGRLAEALIFLKDSYGYEPDNMTLNIRLSREDLANLSNMTTSNAIRTLSAFVAERLITVDGRRIRILNEPMLHKISKHG